MATNPTVARLKEMLDLLSERIDKLEERMHAYEDQANVNHKILERVDETVQGYERTIQRFLRGLKWGGGIVGAALLSQAVIYIFHLFGH